MDKTSRVMNKQNSGQFSYAKINVGKALVLQTRGKPRIDLSVFP